ncbi:uncharacterized protein METZ01_LOCUS293449 [marine metagenome]|uniref:Uncharacterized protein n=1 Tax=marine metagenome TaxID=408172 RepID=A0A382LY05_9ZZZZ
MRGSSFESSYITHVSLDSGLIDIKGVLNVG